MNEQLVGHIKAIYRYPVKSMQGESLDSAEITPFGLAGDRAMALRLPNGRVATAKRTTSLLSYHAYFEDGAIMIKLPSGETLAAADPSTNARLSELLGMEVSAETYQPTQQNFGELDADTIFADVPIQEALEGKKRQLATDAVDYDLAAGTFYDSAHLHLLTTGTLQHLDGLLEGKSELDVGRFRPNIFIESTPDLAGFIEDEWIGGQLIVGDNVVIGEIWPTLRCVMTTLPQRDLPKDTNILRTIVKTHENHLGIFANAIELGAIHIGDTIHCIKQF